MLYLYLVPLQPRVGAPLGGGTPEAPAVGDGERKPQRRGGLLHELRYYARLAEEARQAEAALVRHRTARPATRPARAAVSEQPLGQLTNEDEIVLAYLAAYW